MMITETTYSKEQSVEYIEQSAEWVKDGLRDPSWAKQQRKVSLTCQYLSPPPFTFNAENLKTIYFFSLITVKSNDNFSSGISVTNLIDLHRHSQPGVTHTSVKQTVRLITLKRTLEMD